MRINRNACVHTRSSINAQVRRGFRTRRFEMSTEENIVLAAM